MIVLGFHRPLFTASATTPICIVAANRLEKRDQPTVRPCSMGCNTKDIIAMGRCLGPWNESRSFLLCQRVFFLSHGFQKMRPILLVCLKIQTAKGFPATLSGGATSTSASEIDTN